MDADIPQDQGAKQAVGHGRPPVEHRFKPGQSGNPGGRPRGRSITARLRELLDRAATDPLGDPTPGKTYGDLVAEALIREAAAGEVKAVKELIDRVEGKARPSEPDAGAAEARDVWAEVCDEIERSTDERP